jgi:CubicO group peptidase (beta-lactamase class C family)
MFPLLLALLIPPSLDDAVRAALGRWHVPGAIVALVRQGQAAAVTGYGMADAAARTPVDPQRTAFRTASVSKVVTAAIVAQLIDEGRLDATADVNRYLDFTIPAYDGKPITLAHLLTHTAGFDDRYIGKSARSFELAMPLGAYLKRNLPKRIVPPGEIFLYSNYSVALAGYIAERVCGKPFAELAQSMVFRPLGMTDSSFLLAQPAAIPYQWTGSAYQALPWDYLQDAPAGMQMSSGADMARFVQWALDHASRPEFQVHFTHNARLSDGIGWVWELGRSRGHPFAGHDGGTPGVVARVRIFPHDGAGYFIAANALSGPFLGEVAAAVERQILDKVSPAPVPPPARWDANVAAFTGVYRDVRYSHDTLVKVGVLMGYLGSEITIGAASGGITVPRFDGSTRRMVQVAPNLFQSLDGSYFCAFRRDSSGRVTHLFTSGTTAMERVPALLSAPTQRYVFLFCALALVLLMVAPTRRWLLPDPLRAPASLAANAFGFHLLGLGIVLQLLTSSVEREGSYMYGLPWPIWIVQSLGVLGAACVGWFLVRLFQRRPRSVLPWLVGVILTVYVAWLWHWRLLGYWV